LPVGDTQFLAFWVWQVSEPVERRQKMEMKKVLAGWSKVCPGCNIGRKYPDSFIGKKVRNHWEKGCSSHDAYVEVYGSDEPSPKKSKEESEDK
jgi:hypothetical protein